MDVKSGKVEFSTDETGYRRDKVDEVMKRLTERYNELYDKYAEESHDEDKLTEDLMVERELNQKLATDIARYDHEIAELTERITSLEFAARKTPQSVVGLTSVFEFDEVIKRSQEAIEDARTQAAEILKSARLEYAETERRKQKVYDDVYEILQRYREIAEDEQ